LMSKVHKPKNNAHYEPIAQIAHADQEI
jgi:hypothetical protein